MTQPTITRRSFVKSAAALGAACGLGVAVSDDLVHVDPAHADTGGDVKIVKTACRACLLYTSDAADDSLRVDLGGRRIIKKVAH